MNSFATRFTPLLLIFKLGLLLGSRLYVSESNWLYCNFNGQILYFTDVFGLAYVATFAFQLILAAEQVRVTPYEGALGSKIFGDKITSTFCASLITCCGKIPDYENAFDIEDLDDENKKPDER